MNSRGNVNETNLVNFSADLPTLNQLDTKDGLLSFPFDHLYACHSESSDRRPALQLDKEVEISTHCVVAEDKGLIVQNNPEISRLRERLASSERQNKKLKDLLVHHLDLIQQQNELMTKRDKLYQALKQENETLKSRLNRMDRRITVSQRHSINPPPLVHVQPPTVTSTVVKSEPGTATQIMLNSYTELLLPDNRTNSFLFDNELNKSKQFEQKSIQLTRPSNTVSDVTSYLTSNLGVSTILDPNLKRQDFAMIDNKRSFVKKEMKTENRSSALYTITSNSGNPVIQRIQRNRKKTSTGIGSLSRMPKNPVPKVETPETRVYGDVKGYDHTFGVNKKSKMINTYGKTKTSNFKRTSRFTGSLSDRLQLIDTTPTGEDPYQLGEADMREQSPIPKLMLQKTNHGRMKICTDTTPESTATSRRVYNSNVTATNTKASKKIKVDRYSMSSTYIPPAQIKKERPKTVIVQEPDLDIVKTESEIDWRMYNPNKPGNETSLCDFSYGETPNNLASQILPPLDSVVFQDLFSLESPLPLHLDGLNPLEYGIATDKSAPDKSKKRGARTTSLIGPNFIPVGSMENHPINDSKRGRKRALSTTGLKTVKRETTPKVPKPKLIKPKPAVCRAKKIPTPGMVTNKPYHTLVGDPDLSWYLGLDPDVKLEDVDHTDESKVSTVEVPRWREKPYTSCYTLEGTENLDDKVFEKRHQKLEAEERRQLRWHMRRIREQRHVERLRQRQRDSWCAGGSASPAHASPAVYTVWPQPQRDVRFIEITDALPVMAFGDILPALPESDFMLPWVRTSKALKRAKRAKTLH